MSKSAYWAATASELGTVPLVDVELVVSVVVVAPVDDAPPFDMIEPGVV